MEPYWSRDFFNPSAIYVEGQAVKKVLDLERIKMAKLLGVGHKNIIFTSGGTESANLAILGAFEESLSTLKRPHLIISSTEHSAVARAAEEVKRRGGEVSVVEVNEEGVVSFESLKSLIKKSTFLVSIGLASSEIGTVQPVAKFARLIKEYRRINNTEYPYLHTDASQAPNYLPISLENLQVDLLTLDASKVYGPRGIGALVVKTGVKIRPIIVGGQQEGSLRAGTPNTSLIVGFVRALEIALKDREKEAKRLEVLRSHFVERVVKYLPQAIINGSKESHLPNMVSVSSPGILSEFLLLKLDAEGVLVSVGSACSHDERESGSPVIRALGKPELAESTTRFSFGRFTTADEIKRAVEIFARVASK
jgi:cysteine desulfurase